VAAVGTKHLDAITHSARSTAGAMRRRPDIVHYHALGPGLLAPVPRILSRARVVLTVHGLDNERAKWGWTGRAALGTAHWMSARVPDVTIVVSRALVDHYSDRFGRETVYLPNGVDPPSPRPPGAVLRRYGLTPGGYLLFVGRLVPEKGVDLLIRAYRAVSGDRRLVIAGGSSFTDEYVGQLHQLAREDQRVVLTDYVYGDRLAELYSNAAAFVLPSHLEGMALTLLEAISYGLPIVASDIAPNREVAVDGPGYRLFRAGSEPALAAALDRVLACTQHERTGATQLRERVLAEHSWDTAAQQMHEIYLGLVRASATPSGVIQ
jgi:glycosyltransferase involved in cell wall biosynthesis